jgi:hypothetical protein
MWSRDVRVSSSELWARRYNGPGNGSDEARSVAASPDWSEVFVTGDSQGTTFGRDYATVSYDASTGATLWVTPVRAPHIYRRVLYAAASDGFALGLAENRDVARVEEAGVVADAAAQEIPRRTVTPVQTVRPGTAAKHVWATASPF